MNHSEAIDQIAAALAQAQGQFVNPPRNRTVSVKTKAGDTYTFAYATLDGIMDMIRVPLTANGLAIVHALREDDKGPVCETHLLHTSGQWLSTWTPVLVPENADAQKWGSALTYARRYGVCSLLSIAADEDDDGNAACGNSAKQQPRKAPPKAEPKPAPQSPPTVKTDSATFVARFQSVLDDALKADDLGKLDEMLAKARAWCDQHQQATAWAAVCTAARNALQLALPGIVNRTSDSGVLSFVEAVLDDARLGFADGDKANMKALVDSKRMQLAV